MHRARVIFQVTNKVGSNDRFASWLLNRPQTFLGPVNGYRQTSSAAAEPFLNGSSSAYVETMYNTWLADSSSVHASWDAFFRNATNGAQPGSAYTSPPNLSPYNKNEVPLTSLVPAGAGMPSIAAGSPINEKIIDDHLAVQAIIRSYQIRGHHIANLDPLEIMNSALIGKNKREVIHNSYRFGKKTREPEIQKAPWSLVVSYVGSYGGEAIFVYNFPLATRLEKP